MKLQIIVTTMHQNDFSIIDKMKIVSDVIITNQSDSNSISFKRIKNGEALLVTTTSRGLSRNRNIGIEFLSSNSDYVMFADDDLIFNNEYLTLIEDEFKTHPGADAIKFNLSNLSTVRKISMSPTTSFKKATRRSVSASGVWGLVIKKSSLIKYNLRFNELFGTGTENYCGEDTIFFQEMINKGIKLYLSPINIAGIDQTESSWFEGYTEKYFKTTGMVLAAIYPMLSYLLALRGAYRFSKRKKCSLNFIQIFKCYLIGIHDYKSLG